MRALCGAIITAGALIGLGLTALGFGTRYQTVPDKTREGEVIQLHLSQIDKPLVFVLVFLTIVAIIGVGLAILGLAYHHHRRHHELLRGGTDTAAHQQRITTGP